MNVTASLCRPQLRSRPTLGWLLVWALNPLLPLHAQTAPSLPPPLPTAAQVQAAVERLPQLQAARAAQDLARAQATRRALGPDDWTLKLGHQRRRDTAGPASQDSDLALETTWRSSAKRAADQALATRQHQLADLALAEQQQALRRDLLVDWFALLGAHHTAQVWQTQADLALQQRDITQRRVRAGDAAQRDLLAADTDLAQQQAQAALAQARADQALQQLAQRHPALGLPTSLPARLPDPPPPEDTAADAQVQHLLEHAPTLARAEADAQWAQALAERSGLDRQADPTVGVRAARERSGQEQVLGVYLSWPLGQAGRRADHEAAQAEARQALHRADQAREQVQTQAQLQVQDRRLSHRHWQRQQAVLAQVQASLALQARAYELGESPLAELLQARRQALEVRLATETARLDAWLAWARWALDAGQLWPNEDKNPGRPLIQAQ